MGLDKIWVFGEVAGDEVASITLEMLAAARSLADTVEVFMAGDGGEYAEQLGEHGAETVYSTGDLAGGLQGVAIASAVAAAIEAGDVEAPDAFLLGTTQDGRDVAGRLSVKLDTPVITNVVALEVDETLIGSEPVFGGTVDVKTKNTSGKPGIFLVRPKSYEAVGVGGSEADTEDLDVPDLGAVGAAKVVNSHAEEADGPKLDEAAIVVSGGRGLGSPEAYVMVEESRQGGSAAPRVPVPCHRRRRMGALHLPGRPDRQGREADGVHRRRNLRSHPAPGRHEGVQEHHRDQQGPRGADFRRCGPRHRG